jgi:membrane associated rhomboid family serine protease
MTPPVVEGRTRRRILWGGLLLLVLAVDVVTLVFADLPPVVKTAGWTALSGLVAGIITLRFLAWRMENAQRRDAYSALRARKR